MIILTEKERKVILRAIQTLNPNEDIIGCLLSKTDAHRVLGDTGIVRLARKLTEVSFPEEEES
jgi:hypothetical protein